MTDITPAETTTQTQTKITGIDIGITRGGAKEQYLQNHFYHDQRLTDMIVNVTVPLSAQRMRAMTLHHVAKIANENTQNDLRLMLDAKCAEEIKNLCAAEGIAWDRASQEIKDRALIDACTLIDGLITVYIDQFVGLEDRYEVFLV